VYLAGGLRERERADAMVAALRVPLGVALGEPRVVPGPSQAKPGSPPQRVLLTNDCAMYAASTRAMTF